MSLNWELTNVQDWETKCFYEAEDGNKMLRPVTHVIVLATAFLGIPEITEKTALEFAKRLRVYQGVFGALMRKGDEPHYIGASDILEHIGLKTNAQKDSRTSFMKRVWDTLDKEVAYEARKAVEKADFEARKEAGEFDSPTTSV
jgi:hypothetical protein